ncbi:hypothetical protein [Dinghuibacter silviterrae]|uniref:Uncharacterized protein n=1 Tax=Dinghuibacter silviterrae TaxID=1539049 RepID=A0A4V3GLX7_9BACT|nr:hypothetical protein [Dinghuibacter silviterrae]TDX01183.1 hypothetical protein EDB95_2215 [Dinghuibacter silviterrae]
MQQHAHAAAGGESRSVADAVSRQRGGIAVQRRAPVAQMAPLALVPSTPVVQLLKIYRVQDNDAEKKRLTISDTGDVTVNKGPLNISIGVPDHALYYAAGARGNFDVVEFEVDDDKYKEIAEAVASQSDKERAEGTPTFNDATKPGHKIEIPEGPWLEKFKAAIVAGTGKVTGGPAFAEKAGAIAFSEKAVLSFVSQIFDFGDKAADRQVAKALKENGLEYDEDSGKFVNESATKVDWKELKARLWQIHNNYIDKNLRGAEGGGKVDKKHASKKKDKK